MMLWVINLLVMSFGLGCDTVTVRLQELDSTLQKLAKQYSSYTRLPKIDRGWVLRKLACFSYETELNYFLHSSLYLWNNVVYYHNCCRQFLYSVSLLLFFIIIIASSFFPVSLLLKMWIWSYLSKKKVNMKSGIFIWLLILTIYIYYYIYF